MIWKRAWELEKNDWSHRRTIYRKTSNLDLLGSEGSYLVWWQISDTIPNLMKQCEIMSKLVCGASDLKCDKQNLRNEHWTARTCEVCDLFELKDAKHLNISNPSVTTLRSDMIETINESCHGTGRLVLASATNLLAMFLGKPNSRVYSEDINWEIFCVIAEYVYQMYTRLIKQRDRIG